LSSTNNDGLSFGAVSRQYQSILGDDIGKQTYSKIAEARKVTMSRVDPILESMVEFLNSFEVSED